MTGGRYPHRVIANAYLEGFRIRRTEVRPICTRRAISDLLTPARCSFRISAACMAAVTGRPSRFPFSRACARPPRVRSRRISLSNSAKMASRPAMARPAGVVKSSASVRETNPTPRCSSSWRVASRSVTDRPQRSSRAGRRTPASPDSASPASADHSSRHGSINPHETFSPSSVPGQKRYRILPLERPVWRPFQSVT